MKLKLTRNTIQKIIKWCWNIVFLYSLIVITIIMIDANNNPEFYNAVESRPQATGIVGNEFNTITTVPEWYKDASTIQECKPLVNLMDKFNLYIKPAWRVFIILVIVSYIVQYWDFIKRAAKKFEDNQEDE